MICWKLSPRRRDLRFQVVASDLGVLTAGARGSLRAEGTLRGTPAAMLVRAEAAGRNLDYQGIRAGTLDADIDVDPTGDRTRPARASIVVRDIEAYGQQFKTLRFSLNGPVGGHSLALDLKGDDLALEARGTGLIEGDRWRQSWSGADVDLPVPRRMVALARRHGMHCQLGNAVGIGLDAGQAVVHGGAHAGVIIQCPAHRLRVLEPQAGPQIDRCRGFQELLIGDGVADRLIARGTPDGHGTQASATALH